MISEIWGKGRSKKETALLDEMFKARARLFRDRMKWDVSVDSLGREIDAYDVLNPLYTIATDETGHHVGSMRMLPSSGPTMLAEHFQSLGDGIRFESDSVWEVTRFCVEAGDVAAMKRFGVQRMTQRLMLACCEIGLREDWRCVVGVFDRRMKRIYARVGWSPMVLGQADSPEGPIYLGLWEVEEKHAAKMRELGNIKDANLVSSDQNAAEPTSKRSLRSDVI